MPKFDLQSLLNSLVPANSNVARPAETIVPPAPKPLEPPRIVPTPRVLRPRRRT